MNATTAAVLISGIGLLLSCCVSLLIVGIAWGSLRQDVRQLKESRATLATKDQVTSLATQVARIEGMFTMTLKSEHTSAA